jgi:hypothetical protein
VRSLIADGLVAITQMVIRWIDPSVGEIHITRVRVPFGAAFPIPDPDPRCREVTRQGGLTHDDVLVHL